MLPQKDVTQESDRNVIVDTTIYQKKFEGKDNRGLFGTLSWTHSVEWR